MLDMVSHNPVLALAAGVFLAVPAFKDGMFRVACRAGDNSLPPRDWHKTLEVGTRWRALLGVCTAAGVRQELSGRVHPGHAASCEPLKCGALWEPAC